MSEEDHIPNLWEDAKPILLKQYEARIIESAETLAKAEIDLLESYAETSRRAADGEYIHAKDFTKAEEKYNKIAEQAEVLKTEINDSPASKYIGNGDKLRLFEKFEKTRADAVEAWKKSNPQIMHDVENVQALDSAFARQYKFPEKNLSIPEGTDTPEKLAMVSLANSPGIAVGEYHPSKAAREFIRDIISVAQKHKSTKIDTIYLEIYGKDFAELNKKSVRELKEIIEKTTPEESKKNAENLAKIYDVKKSDDVIYTTIEVFLAAKKNDIEVVNIDKTGEARETERKSAGLTPSEGLEHRISSTNFTWTQAIIDDRTKNNKTGKFVVLGGDFHFTKGLIDNALGIVVVSFNNREKDTKPLVIRGNDPDSADFYIPGGKDHPDLKKLFEKNPKVLDELNSIRDGSGKMNYGNAKSEDHEKPTQVSQPYPPQQRATLGKHN